jgi:hypothetical protein
MSPAQPSLKILLLTHSFNGLSQRLFVGKIEGQV